MWNDARRAKVSNGRKLAPLRLTVPPELIDFFYCAFSRNPTHNSRYSAALLVGSFMDNKSSFQLQKDAGIRLPSCTLPSDSLNSITMCEIRSETHHFHASSSYKWFYFTFVAHCDETYAHIQCIVAQSCQIAGYLINSKYADGMV